LTRDSDATRRLSQHGWLYLLAVLSFLLGHEGDTINVQHVTETVIQQCLQRAAGLPRR